MLGAGVGLGLGAAYMAGGLSQTAKDHARAERLAKAASEGFSETALQAAAARMDLGVLRVARRHDPFTVAGAAERDRQSAIFAARLEQTAGRDGNDLMLRASLPAVEPAAPFRLSGALETSRELECLTQAVYYEARGETAAGQAAVAQVVLNRVRSPAFPKTVCGVVFQGAGRRGCQFSFACNGAMRSGYEIRAWTRAQRIAARALSGYVMDEVGAATHFHTTAVAPAWGPRLVRVGQVGMHVFYRFGRGGRRAPLDTPAPELTTEPVYAAPQPTPADVAPSDVRLTSLVLEPEKPPAAKPGAVPVPAAPAAPKVGETAQLERTAGAGRGEAAKGAVGAAS
ncbi:MAG: cell wall hydrolase [Phenylobacterium sp.]|uniref:cell wall hydrolase n=1 Tax=Phenylobacterium sp. TaxID=1871053 RepID=UPI00391BAAB4